MEEAPTIQANGAQSYYLPRGSGEPPFLTAAFTCAGSIWSLVEPCLASKHQLYAGLAHVHLECRRGAEVQTGAGFAASCYNPDTASPQGSAPCHGEAGGSKTKSLAGVWSG